MKRVTRIPKICTQQRDFAEVDKFMRNLARGVVDEAFDAEAGTWHIVSFTTDKESYRVLNAFDGWLDCFAGIANAMNRTDYNDAPIRTLISKLRLEQYVSLDLVKQAADVVDIQRKLYMAAPHGVINNIANALLEREAA